MKIEIKRWYDAKVLFECEVPDDTEERFRIRFALEVAVKAGASLDCASLDCASLDDARLDGARLNGARLVRASFDGAIFVHATGIDWTPVRDDFWAVLSSVPAEVEGLRQALINGKVDGSSYQGECVCLVGTLANLRGANYQNLGLLRLTLLRPAEVFFRRINKGDTPDTNEFSKMALDWLDEWLSNMRAVFGVPA